MDDDALIVELEIVNWAAAYMQITAMAKMIGSLGRPLGTANALVLQHQRNVQGVVGPWGRAIRAYNQYLAALKSGSQVQIYDASMNYQQKLKQYQGGGTLSPMQALKNLIFSTRFGYGGGGGLGGLHPLIGRAWQF